MSQIHLYHNQPNEHYNRRHIGFLTAIGTAVGVGGAGAAATVAGGAIVGTAAYGATKILSPKAPSLPDYGISTPQVKAAEPSVDKAAAAAQQNIVQKRKSIARNRTTFTGPTGLTLADKSNITLKELTGV